MSGSREAEADGLGSRESGGKSRRNWTDKGDCGNAVDEGARTWYLVDGDQGALTGLVAMLTTSSTAQG